MCPSPAPLSGRFSWGRSGKAVSLHRSQAICCSCNLCGTSFCSLSPLGGWLGLTHRVTLASDRTLRISSAAPARRAFSPVQAHPGECPNGIRLPYHPRCLRRDRGCRQRELDAQPLTRDTRRCNTFQRCRQPIPARRILAPTRCLFARARSSVLPLRKAPLRQPARAGLFSCRSIHLLRNVCAANK